MYSFSLEVSNQIIIVLSRSYLYDKKNFFQSNEKKVKWKKKYKNNLFSEKIQNIFSF